MLAWLVHLGFWVVFWTGAITWGASGLLGVLALGIYLTEWFARFVGWYDLLMEGINEAQKLRNARRRMAKALKPRQNPLD